MPAALTRRDRLPVLWRVLPGLTPYSAAIAAMHVEQERIAAGDAREAVWLLESPSGFNRGNRSRADQAPQLAGVPVEDPPGEPRAGDWTYHGPGVCGGIVMLDLAARRKDLAAYVELLHAWLAAALAAFVVTAIRRPEIEGAGLWVGEAKIAAVGLNRRGWTMGYGFALYVAPNLGHFAAMAAPCGVPGKSVTSLAAELKGRPPAMADVDAALRTAFHEYFGPTSLADAPVI